jgi:cellulose biosynthesis protein BcsQ
MDKICIFNHKGGVSKTTTAFHVGWMLARKGEKVLLVDADSQCNLSLYFLGYKDFEKYYEKDNKNLKNALEPAFKALPKLIEAADSICNDRNENLFLLPGNIDFSENEVQMGVSFQLSNALGTMKNLPGAFPYLVSKTGEEIGATIAIIDMNPSLSAINQDIFISSDYFIIPTSPDVFSNMAVKSLARILPQWANWAKKAHPLYADASYPLPAVIPKFLGFTINDFNLSYGKPQHNYRMLIDTINKSIKDDLIPKLNDVDMLLTDELYKKVYDAVIEKTDKGNFEYNSKYCLGEISNFNKLIAISNDASIPVFELAPDRLPYSTESQAKTLRWFNTLYRVISWRIQRLIRNDCCKTSI